MAGEAVMNISALRGRPLRLCLVLSGGAGVVLVLSAAAPSSAADAPARTPTVTEDRATTSGGTWGPAKTVAAALNTGGGAAINSLSCGSAGNCVAGGYYSVSSPGSQQAFVIKETNGTWGKATEVAAALNTGGSARVNAVSCVAAGNCSAGGYYTGRSGAHQAFVINETSGTWGIAKQVAAALNAGGYAETSSVSCASAGNCSAGGYYKDFSTHSTQAFVVSATNGTWGPAKQVAAALNTGRAARIESVSCGSAGNCSAGGFYAEVSQQEQAFVVGETNGTWGTATEVAAALNVGGGARIDSVSCAAAGNCSAGGGYSSSSGEQA